MKLKGLSAFFVPALSAAVIFLSSCASTPKEEVPFVPSESDTVSIPIPVSTASRSYFSSINQDALSAAENGSPESLRQTAFILHRPLEEDYTEQEKVLLFVCSRIMSIAWPEESAGTETVDNADQDNPYAGALDSAARGIYDSSTGNSDFLTMVLPSLVLLTSSTRTDYYQESYASLSAALVLRNNSVLANYLMGHLMLRLDKADQALSYFSKALNGSKNNFEILSSMANAYGKCGKYENAVAQAEALLENHPQNLSLLMVCAESYYNMGNLDKAEDYVLRVLQIQPENLSYVLFRANILIDKGDFIRASSLLDVYSRSDQTSKKYLLLRARMQRDWNKNNNAAAETIGKAVSLYPEDTEVLLFAANIASSSNMLVADRNALELANSILEIDGLNTGALEISIKEMIKLNNMTEAYEKSRQLLSMPDVSDTAVYSHVDLCLSLGYNDEAWRIAQELYSKNPENEDVLQTYIKVLVGTNRRTQASELISRLMPDASSKMKSFLYYERSFFGSDSDEVLSDLRASLTANPRNRDSLYRLYQIYYGRKDWKRAQYYLKQVVALEPTNSTILALNAELDALLGR